MRKGTSGNIMLLVLACIAVMGISFYTIVEYALSEKRQVVKTSHMLELKFALSSTLDFVLFGVKQKYCFTDVLMSDPNCTKNHSGSTERLIMSLEQVSFMVAAKTITNLEATSIRLAKITRDLPLAEIAVGHPLYFVYSRIRNHSELKDIGYVHVEIERDESAFLPRSGNEVYLSVKVSLTRTKGAASVVTVGREKLEANSRLVIHPREVGSFALLVPRDVYLGNNEKNPGIDGDVRFYGAGNKNEYAGLPGLLFLSPVFVNRDVILNGNSYSPVTFADRVYLGEGRVQTATSGTAKEPYKPLTKGGAAGRYWREVPSFGGFLKGIENDGARDAGLRAFVGDGVTSVPDKELMSKCIERNLSQSSLPKLLTSALNIETIQSSASKYSYMLKLTNSEFEGQKFQGATDTSNWNGNVNVDSEYNNLVMRLDLTAGSNSSQFYMSKKGEAKAVVAVESTVAEGRLRGDWNAATAAYNIVKDDPTVSPEEKLQKKTAMDIAKNKLDGYQEMAANPPKITITTQPITRSYDSKTYESKSRVKFDVNIENLNHMLDYGGNPNNVASLLDNDGKLVNTPAVSMGMKIFDSGYIDGEFIGKRDDAWKNANDKGNKFKENQNLFRTFKFNGNQASPSVASVVPSDPIAPGAIDYESQGETCMSARDAMDSQAFGMADATVSFANSTRISWNFAGDADSSQDPLTNSITFDGNNAKAGASNTTFQVRSIVGTCTIKGTANFVTGFFACDKLIIEPRNEPLRIIGTFIVGSLEIAPQAYKAGIIWSSIYHPQAVTDLRNEGILKKTSGSGPCGSGVTSPIWHPIPSIQEVVDRMTCNVISLRAKADPFQWTTVDPDCGLLAGNSNTVCKKRLIRFFVIEQDRSGAI